MSGLETLPEDLLAELASACLKLGVFDFVNQSEPKSAPSGIGAAVWVQSIRPATNRSSLVATSARFECSIRIYQDMLYEPLDMIDPAVMSATWLILQALSAGITLGGQIEYFDLLGSDGEPLGGEAGYVTIEQKIFRVMTITVPMIIEDAFPQSR